MSAEVADVLRDALALIEDEENWCKGEYRRETARSFAYCSIGALAEASGKSIEEVEDATKSPELVALTTAMDPTGWVSVPGFNDSHTHAEVIAAFKDAIVAEEWSE